jgi:tetratricopeptide (TPR) repeat protein
MQNFAKKVLSFLAIVLFISSCDTRQDRIAAAEGKGRLAESKYDQGDYAQAVMLAREAVNELIPLVGSDDSRTLDCRHLLAEFLRAAGKIEEAISEHRKVVEISARVLGETDENTLNARIRLAAALGEIFDSNGDPDITAAQEAEKLCQTTLDFAVKDLGPESTPAMKARQTLAVIQAKSGKFKEAVQNNTVLVEIQRMKLGNEDESTITTRMNLAGALLAQKLYDPALREFQIVYDIRKKRAGEDHPNTIIAEAWIGMCLSDQNQFAEALPVLRDVWERRKRVLGEAHRRTLGAGFNLAVSEIDSGNREEAKRIVTALYEIALKTYGPGDSQTQMYQQAIEKVK